MSKEKVVPMGVAQVALLECRLPSALLEPRKARSGGGGGVVGAVPTLKEFLNFYEAGHLISRLDYLAGS